MMVTIPMTVAHVILIMSYNFQAQTCVDKSMSKRFLAEKIAWILTSKQTNQPVKSIEDIHSNIPCSFHEL